jgi:hypothetical protein
MEVVVMCRKGSACGWRYAPDEVPEPTVRTGYDRPQPRS